MILALSMVQNSVLLKPLCTLAQGQMQNFSHILFAYVLLSQIFLFKVNYLACCLYNLNYECHFLLVTFGTNIFVFFATYTGLLIYSCFFYYTGFLIYSCFFYYTGLLIYLCFLLLYRSLNIFVFFLLLYRSLNIFVFVATVHVS